ncbi:MAG: hypothetical protein ACLSUW_03270 [Akkermansia sp.]
MLTVSRDGQQFNVKVDARPFLKNIASRILEATKGNAIIPHEL